MSEVESSSQPPQWMLLLENKQKKQHRLAHEIGAGASCMKCEGSCPGLDLHFWRKLCRNCKCKKEDHDIVDDDNYLQFEILLNSSGSKAKVKPAKAVLDLKLKKEDVKLVTGNAKGIKDNNKGIVFDWVPPDVSKDLAAEYMQHLPPNKMPITGSSGAHHRRQQLEYQIPLHDLAPNVCHDLSASEIQGLKDYLENVRNNVVGQGRIQKIGIQNQYIEYSVPCNSMPQALHSNKTGNLINLNSTPKPFMSTNYEGSSYLGAEDFPPPPLELITPSSDLKTPSEFLGKDLRKREKSPHPNSSLQRSKSPHTLQDPSEILREDISKSLDKRFATTSILNYQNNNQIMSNSLHDISRDPNVLDSNVNIMPYDTLNTANNENYALNNNTTSKQLAGSLVKNTIPYHVTNSDKNFTVAHPQNSRVLHPSLAHLEDKSSVLPGAKNSSLQDGTLQKNSNLPTFVQHSNPTNPQEPSLSHSICSQQHHSSLQDGTLQKNSNLPTFVQHSNPTNPQEPSLSHSICSQQHHGHTFIHQPGFDSAPQGYRQVPDRLNELKEGFDTLSLGQQDEFPHTAVKSTDSVAKSLDCLGCHEVITVGQVAVLAERAGNSVAWHPQCFVCHTCKELLVDLIYFFHKGNVFCGRHYADMMQIPRCFACDELIFVNEYTIAEGQAFHVRHFCCFECDSELGGKQYIPKNDHPVCLDCYYSKYGKTCHTCKQVIAATEQGVCWKHIDWHARDNCFRCFQCLKSLLGSRFVVKNDQAFCNKDCVLQCSSSQNPLFDNAL